MVSAANQKSDVRLFDSELFGGSLACGIIASRRVEGAEKLHALKASDFAWKVSVRVRFRRPAVAFQSPAFVGSGFEVCEYDFLCIRGSFWRLLPQ